MSTNLNSPPSYLTRIRHLPLLPDEWAVCSFNPDRGIIPGPFGAGRLLVATDRRIISFAGGSSGGETFLAPVEECAAVTVEAGSSSGVSFLQGVGTIAVGLLLYIIISYWLTGHVTGPSVPFINIDLGPLVALFAVLGGVWLAAKQYFSQEQGAMTFHGGNWALSFPYNPGGPTDDVFLLINAVFAARDARRRAVQANAWGSACSEITATRREPLPQG